MRTSNVSGVCLASLVLLPYVLLMWGMMYSPPVEASVPHFVQVAAHTAAMSGARSAASMQVQNQHRQEKAVTQVQAPKLQEWPHSKSPFESRWLENFQIHEVLLRDEAEQPTVILFRLNSSEPHPERSLWIGIRAEDRGPDIQRWVCNFVEPETLDALRRNQAPLLTAISITLTSYIDFDVHNETWLPLEAQFMQFRDVPSTFKDQYGNAWLQPSVSPYDLMEWGLKDRVADDLRWVFDAASELKEVGVGKIDSPQQKQTLDKYQQEKLDGIITRIQGLETRLSGGEL